MGWSQDEQEWLDETLRTDADLKNDPERHHYLTTNEVIREHPNFSTGDRTLYDRMQTQHDPNPVRNYENRYGDDDYDAFRRDYEQQNGDE
jgi:hypothetical protein